MEKTSRRGFFGRVLGGLALAVVGPKLLPAAPAKVGLAGLVDDGLLTSSLYGPGRPLTEKMMKEACEAIFQHQQKPGFYGFYQLVSVENYGTLTRTSYPNLRRR